MSFDALHLKHPLRVGAKAQLAPTGALAICLWRLGGATDSFRCLVSMAAGIHQRMGDRQLSANSVEKLGWAPAGRGVV